MAKTIVPVDPRACAAALLDHPSAARRAGFAERAAACYLLARCGADEGFDVLDLWPGPMAEFKPTAHEDNVALALAIVEIAGERRAAAPAAA
jgi:hypothetical protein